MNFEPGEVVRLKSGGPAMTVEEVSGEISCVWSEKVGNKNVIQRDSFPAVVLEKAGRPAVFSVARG